VRATTVDAPSSSPANALGSRPGPPAGEGAARADEHPGRLGADHGADAGALGEVGEPPRQVDEVGAVGDHELDVLAEQPAARR
jgi:hypothetical protein